MGFSFSKTAERDSMARESGRLSRLSTRYPDQPVAQMAAGDSFASSGPATQRCHRRNCHAFADLIGLLPMESSYWPSLLVSARPILSASVSYAALEWLKIGLFECGGVTARGSSAVDVTAERKPSSVSSGGEIHRRIE